MSDSDDTDILLIIPPDFFIAESSVYNEVDYADFSDALDNRSFKQLNLNHDSCCSTTISEFHTPIPQMSIAEFNNYSELQALNSKLHDLELKLELEKSITSKLAISPRSSGAARRQNCPADTIEMNNYVSNICHSTPKPSSSNYIPNTENNFIKEIDSFLQENKTNDYGQSNSSIRTLATEAIQKHNQLYDLHRTNPADPYSLPKSNGYFGMNGENCKYQTYERSKELSQNTPQPASSEPLISLSDIWGPDGKTENVTLNEERLRREHCEKTIQMLQNKLLEYQQKIAVAMKIDKTKDEALTKLHENSSSQNTKLSKLESTICSLELKQRDDQLLCGELKQKINHLENELAQAIGVAKKFQERNELLEVKVESLTLSTNEIRDIQRKQLEDLEIRLSNSKQNEDIANNELENLKKKHVQLQKDYEKTIKQNAEYRQQWEEAQNETEIVKQQKQSTYDKFREEKNRAEILDKHKKSLHQTIDTLNEKEKSLIKELESQRTSLKTYYQKQLEQVVEQKLREFQKQIDDVEDSLRSDSKQRERLIAERAIKHMELINQKNDQECSLIIEKHNEEIELYRIQLVNASKTINELQGKLGAYQTKRADIAERLHGVMETQWQRALEIITNPNDTVNTANNNDLTRRSIDTSKLDKDKADGVAGLYQTKVENGVVFETPTSSRDRNQHFDGLPNSNDKLQAYIELLLTKSPRDLSQLDDVLNQPNKSDYDKSAKHNFNSRVTTSAGSTICSNRQVDTNKHKPWK